MPKTDAGPRGAVVWDVPVRLVHWALAGLLGFSWYSAETGMMEWHRWSGYAVLALIVFRLCWGVVGSSTARFAAFVRGPAAVARYVGTLRDRAPGTHSGHNPLGALSVVALLLVTIVQVGTGLFAVDVDGIESGPLSDRVSFETGRQLAGIHRLSFTALQVLVVLHVAAILFYLVYKRDNLIGPMIVGRRRGAIAGIVPGSRLALLASIVLAGGIAWFVANGLRLP